MEEWKKIGEFIKDQTPRLCWAVIFRPFDFKSDNPHFVKVIYFKGEADFSRYQSDYPGYIDRLGELDLDNIRLLREIEKPEVPSISEIPIKWHIDQETKDVFNGMFGEDCVDPTVPVSNQSYESWDGTSRV